MSVLRTVPSTPRLTKSKSLREQVYESVRNRIRDGSITQEERLVDLELAAQLGVSRMPAREALMQLVHEGMLESTSRGFMLRTFLPHEIEEIFEIRRLLEPAAAASAAKNMSIASLHQLEGAIRQCEISSEAGDVHAFIVSIAEFRGLWLQRVPNMQLAEVIVRFADHVQAIRLATLRGKSVRDDALKRMRSLCESFRAEDSAGAAAKIEMQVLAALDAFRRNNGKSTT